MNTSVYKEQTIIQIALIGLNSGGLSWQNHHLPELYKPLYRNI